MEINEITIYSNPMAKPRMTRADRWKKRPCVVKYFAYSEHIKWQTQLQKYRPADELVMIFNIPMPQSWSKKKKAKMFGQPHQQTPDIDNLEKGILDSLFVNDMKVWKVCASKRWSDCGSIIIKNWSNYSVK